MTHPYHHAVSSAKKWGGDPEDYQAIHDWFDESKLSCPVFVHRAVRHHAEGIFEAEAVFGKTITISTGKKVPVRYIGEQHVKEDCGGHIPTRNEWLTRIQPKLWMSKGYSLTDQEVQDVY